MRSEPANRNPNSSMTKEYLLDLPTNVLLERISSLPEKSVIFYSLIFQDGNGKRYVPYVMAKEIASHANVPVFSHWDPLFGSGIAGGYMLSSERVGKAAGREIMKLLYQRDLPLSPLHIFQHKYDWERLQHFHMMLNNLPKSSIFLHKPESFYTKYAWQINLGISMLFLLLIIIFLWIMALRYQVDAQTKALKKQKQYAEKQAATDQLTGLLNRHAMEVLIDEEISLSHRQLQPPMSLLMVDIDHFKQINDTYGHHVGDEVLKFFANTLKPHLRRKDYLARWGGEEFIILSLDSSIDDAAIFAEQLRSAIASFQHETLPSFTVSIGIAEYQPGQSFESWYKKADLLLYEAKEKGRNRICW